MDTVIEAEYNSSPTEFVHDLNASALRRAQEALLVRSSRRFALVAVTRRARREYGLPPGAGDWPDERQISE